MGSEFSMNNLDIIFIIVIIAAILGLVLFIFIVVKLYNLIVKANKVHPTEESVDQQSVQQCVEGIQVQCSRSNNQEQDIEVAAICLEPHLRLNQIHRNSECISNLDKSQNTEILQNLSIIQEKPIFNVERVPLKPSIIYPLQVQEIKLQQ